MEQRVLSKIYTDVNEYMPELRGKAQKYVDKMMGRLKQNPDYDKFRTLQRVANMGDVRMNVYISQELGDRVIIQLADRKTPTVKEIFSTVIPNLFRSGKKQVDLPTMSAQEGRVYLKRILKGIVIPPKTSKTPVKVVEFNVNEPFANNLQNAIRELGNERLFGFKIK